jgi:hypothetical protein
MLSGIKTNIKNKAKQVANVKRTNCNISFIRSGKSFCAVITLPLMFYQPNGSGGLRGHVFCGIRTTLCSVVLLLAMRL